MEKSNPEPGGRGEIAPFASRLQIGAKLAQLAQLAGSQTGSAPPGSTLRFLDRTS